MRDVIFGRKDILSQAVFLVSLYQMDLPEYVFAYVLKV